ncbi:MAG: response regulator [Patescibacteria group bacterium]
MKILLVEDDRDVEMAVRGTLRMNGFFTESVSDLGDVEELIEKSDFFPDLVILDPFSDYTFAMYHNQPDEIQSLIKRSLEKIFQLDSSIKVIISSAWDWNIEEIKKGFPDAKILFHSKCWEDSVKKLLELVHAQSRLSRQLSA